MFVKNLQLALWIKPKNLRCAPAFNRLFKRLSHDAAEFVGVELEIVDSDGGVFADGNHFNFTGRGFNCGMGMKVLALPACRGQSRRFGARALRAKNCPFVGIKLGQSVSRLRFKGLPKAANGAKHLFCRNLFGHARNLHEQGVSCQRQRRAAGGP